MRWTQAGLVCAPRAAPDLAAAALARVPLPLHALEEVPGWPDPPSDWVAGWYRRSPDHAPGPPGVPELIQTRGPAFGAAGHETSSLCLGALRLLPAGPAVDAGCGSGLLSLAWAALGRGPVVAWDLDPDAVRQTREAAALAGLDRAIDVRQGPVERVDAGGRVLLANLPAPAHRTLLESLVRPPRAALLAGMRQGAGREIVAGYRGLGMRVCARGRRGVWERWVLVER